MIFSCGACSKEVKHSKVPINDIVLLNKDDIESQHAVSRNSRICGFYSIFQCIGYEVHIRYY